MARKTYSEIAREVLEHFEKKYDDGEHRDYHSINDFLAENIDGIIIRSLEVSYNDQLYCNRFDRGRI